MNAIEFDHVGKQYRLGLVSTGTFTQDLNRWWTMNVRHKEDPNLKIGETNDRSKKGDSNYVWALKDINFSIEQGDVVGIIGKNGAGKSTLLKLLSRVTTPTVGEIRARGRIASLLEVGTGFHPEMTGRENIFMNGAIMGMTKQEIGRKLDEIIDFSGCERYIDTPVKRYSSGMTVRLGFAIAAHLEPEILVVDEVLAVGDAEFQKKAIGKMQDVSKGGGRTVLFVSHNMASIRTLCNHGILLENGMVKAQGSINDVVNEYMSGYDLSKRLCKWNVDEALPASFTSIRVYVEGKTDDQLIDMSDRIKVAISYEVKEDLHNTNISFSLFRDSIPLFHSWDIDNLGEIEKDRQKGKHVTTLTLPDFLLPGKYSISIDIGRPNIGVIQRKEDCLQFEISNVITDGSRKSFTRGGVVKTDIIWKDKLL
ncbi:Wzt C-terminal domain-containing protein [Prevotella sp. tc2-28]|uniref:ABC transporter ATP-binding protein n=1 Tax=Prevotella sp. tc2-28 TaxID=1761888 RepID=UPI0008979D8B|nr:ABC transporter ATP-binding protein [Prevotella sp. tc2-28]SEA92320.1 Wzt C-terminal domain-containing protein [Prevotella sp. tc2-28]